MTLREGAPVIAKIVKIPETCLSGYLHQTPNKVNERIHPNRFEYSQGIGTKDGRITTMRNNSILRGFLLQWV